MHCTYNPLCVYAYMYQYKYIYNCTFVESKLDIGIININFCDTITVTVFSKIAFFTVEYYYTHVHVHNSTTYLHNISYTHTIYTLHIHVANLGTKILHVIITRSMQFPCTTNVFKSPWALIQEEEGVLYLRCPVKANTGTRRSLVVVDVRRLEYSVHSQSVQ